MYLARMATCNFNAGKPIVCKYKLVKKSIAWADYLAVNTK
jgi:hypothetical protein